MSASESSRSTTSRGVFQQPGISAYRRRHRLAWGASSSTRRAARTGRVPMAKVVLQSRTDRPRRTLGEKRARRWKQAKTERTRGGMSSHPHRLVVFIRIGKGSGKSKTTDVGQRKGGAEKAGPPKRRAAVRTVA